jgi:hypothetical protein
MGRLVENTKCVSDVWVLLYVNFQISTFTYLQSDLPRSQ